MPTEAPTAGAELKTTTQSQGRGAGCISLAALCGLSLAALDHESGLFQEVGSAVQVLPAVGQNAFRWARSRGQGKGQQSTPKSAEPPGKRWLP